MESAPQSRTTQRIRNDLDQRFSDGQELAPDEVNDAHAALVRNFRSSVGRKSPEEMCAKAHRSGEIFEGGYRGDGR